MSATILLLVWSGKSNNSSLRYWLLAGVFSGLCAWTKNEGWMFLVIVFFIYLGFPLLKKPRENHWQRFKMFFRGLGPILLILIYHKLILAPSNDIINSAALDSVGQLMEVERYPVIVKAFFSKLIPLDFKNATPYFILTSIPIFFGLNFNLLKKPWMVRAIITVLAVLLGYAVIYLISPLELQFHLGSSLNRLYLHIWPITIFLFYQLVKLNRVENRTEKDPSVG
jgi:hypothetical protein